MSSSGKPKKRQRPAEVSQDVKIAPYKRLKTEVAALQQTPVVVRSDERKKSSEWSLKLMSRGSISTVDPVFSADEKYLFLSRGNAVQVYSIAMQRVTKTLAMKDASHVAGLYLVPSHPQYLFISTVSGSVIQWDWVEDREVVNREQFGKMSLYQIVALSGPDEQGQRMACFALKTRGAQNYIVVNMDWATRKDSVEHIVLEHKSPISHFKVVHSGRVIIASGRQQLIIGMSRRDSKEQGIYNDYEWREYRLPVKQITCLDVCERNVGPPEEASFDIAIGDASGAILVYNDVLSSVNLEDTSGLPLLQRLHWHREAVAAVSWSRDGNYIISGGKESVIVFWQLDSGRRNFLPHLSAPIRQITVSSIGALYAVRLADKSITVISATELKSVATIESLRLPYSDSSQRRKAPAVFHPHYPEQLLLGGLGADSTHLSALQVFNIESGLVISRQALTRTNVTILNKGPEGTPISTPDVQFMDISGNGQWLATIDSWTQPRQDVEAYTSPLLPDESHAQKQNETFLKFWKWNEKQGNWELATRIESPHLASSGSAAQILCLAARPDRSEFVTLGADLNLKIWQPLARHITSSKSSSHRTNLMESTWKSLTSIDLSYAGRGALTASMAFSKDGSILAVGLHKTVHLIDYRTLVVKSSRQIFGSESIQSIQFQDRFLIALSDQSLAAWNVVDGVIHTPTTSATSGSSWSKNIALAVDGSSDTFAVVTQTKGTNLPGQSSRKPTYRLAVYDTSRTVPISESVLEKAPIKLLADPNHGGYLIVDSAENLWRYNDPYRTSHIVAMMAETSKAQESAASAGLDNIFGRTSPRLSQDTRQLLPVPQQPTTTTSTLKAETLGAIFNHAPPFALPPATALFKDVINALVSSS